MKSLILSYAARNTTRPQTEPGFISGLERGGGEMAQSERRGNIIGLPFNMRN